MDKSLRHKTTRSEISSYKYNNVNRLMACFYHKVVLVFYAVLSAFRIKPKLKAVVHYIPGLVGFWAAGMIFFAVSPAIVRGQSPETPDAVNPQYEYNVKAAFLYSFGHMSNGPKTHLKTAQARLSWVFAAKIPLGRFWIALPSPKRSRGTAL